MDQHEKEFSVMLNRVGDNARVCAMYGYCESTIHYTADGDQDLFDRLNDTAYIWNLLIGALQGSSFIALGRLYDTAKGTETLRRLLEYAATYPGIFSRAALVGRKQSEGMS